uniref:LOB domain-containing protein 24-like n=1 Tax=Erigeron canadensis TaxID=72917 RepID=UPI001CB927EF|nr:LOB domain-containing protein 24-like [Erigeron canadensis]
MTTTRCAACKYFRRRCPSNCNFAPYFPSNNPQRFVCVHRIYGANNIGKMLEGLPEQLRGNAIECLYYEAKCRIQDPVYGCVSIISQLHWEIRIAQTQLAKAQAEIALLDAGVEGAVTTSRLGDQQNGIDHGVYDPFNSWFY